MRQILWLLVGMIFIWASTVHAKGLEIIAPPLQGRGTICMVTNVSEVPVDVVIEISGLEEGGGSSSHPALDPLRTMTGGRTGFPVPGLRPRVCRVTSEEAKKGDLKVTFCVTTEDGACQAAVTAE